MESTEQKRFRKHSSGTSALLHVASKSLGNMNNPCAILQALYNLISVSEILLGFLCFLQF